MRIVFFGSGPVALATITHLLKHGFEFEFIITKPRPQHHKGEVPVLDFLQTQNITYFTPTNREELSDLFQRKNIESPLGLVVDYGIIINEDVIEKFPKGIINSHFSLLPEWRGADPITFAILSGQTKTGVCLMKIVPKLDEGELIAQETLEIRSSLTTPELTKQLVNLSNAMLIKYLPAYLEGSIEPYPQDTATTTPTFSRKITKQDSILTPHNKTALELEREIRAFAGWPKSRITIGDYNIIITKAHVASDDSAPLTIACKDNTFLAIDELITPNGKKTTGEAFCNGYMRS